MKFWVSRFNLLQSALEEPANERIEGLEDKIRNLSTQIESQFSDMREHSYRLYALFMHRGSGKAGHFWIYLRDFENNVWRSYNDTYVQETKDSEIFQAPIDATNPPNPYIVVYVKDPSLVKSVCREIAADAVRDDVEMVDLKDDKDGEESSFPSMSELPIRWKTEGIVGDWDHSEANVNAQW